MEQFGATVIPGGAVLTWKHMKWGYYNRHGITATSDFNEINKGFFTNGLGVFPPSLHICLKDNKVFFTDSWILSFLNVIIIIIIIICCDSKWKLQTWAWWKIVPHVSIIFILLSAVKNTFLIRAVQLGALHRSPFMYKRECGTSAAPCPHLQGVLWMQLIEVSSRVVYIKDKIIQKNRLQ